MTSRSMKSASDSVPPANKWRLRRTLRRAVDFRPIEAEDIKYLWAAYRQGSFEFDKRDMTASEFKSAFEEMVIAQFHAAWTLFGMTRRGLIPVGVVFAAWAPHAPFLIVTGASWLPWASKRNIIECMVGFLSKIRLELQLQFYANLDHKRLYEVCMMHGIIRRVGTSYVAFPGQPAAVFETRTPEKKAA